MGRDQVAEVLSSRLPISIEKYVRLSLYEMFFNVAEMSFCFFGRAFQPYMNVGVNTIITVSQINTVAIYIRQ